MQNIGNNIKVTIIFQFLEKTLHKFYKNPTFVTFCDATNDAVILLMSKDVLIIKEQLCQSYMQLLAQLVRSLPSDHKVPGSIPALPRFEYFCNLLFRLSQLSFPSFRGR